MPCFRAYTSINTIFTCFIYIYIFFFFADGGNLQKTPCGPCPRIVWDSYPLNLPTLSLRSPHGTAARHYFAGRGLAVLQLFLQCSSLDLYPPQTRFILASPVCIYQCGFCSVKFRKHFSIKIIVYLI